MAKHIPSPAIVASHIRRILSDGGSAKHAKGVQWFFKEEIKSHGWYTASLRKAAVRSRREIRKEFGLDFLVQVADRLFCQILEEKIFAVFLAEKPTPRDPSRLGMMPGAVETAPLSAPPDSLKTSVIVRIEIRPWIFPPYKLLCASAISMPGCFTTIIIAIPSPTGCWDCRKI